ncbi:hypothetical protein, partial [Spongiactinospora gelatinilytica]|uniref:hypothetical protein n=1 Tax=Spongiactinospora gelatinilytica TaxID=2666298 RepID=UPI001F2028F8
MPRHEESGSDGGPGHGHEPPYRAPETGAAHGAQTVREAAGTPAPRRPLDGEPARRSPYPPAAGTS